MTVKELRNMLYKACDEAEVEIDNCEVVMIRRVVDLKTEKEFVQLYTYAHSDG